MNLIPTPKPLPSLGRHIVATLGRNMLNLGLLVSAFIVVATVMPQPMEYAPHADAPQVQTVTAADLVERHGCWTGEAPADMEGKFPGHVVVSAPGHGPQYRGQAMVEKALGQLFDGEAHGLTVYAFCR